MGAFSAIFGSLTWSVGVAFYSRLAERYPPYVINTTRALLALPLCIASIFFVLGWADGVEAIGQVSMKNVLWFHVGMLSSYAFGDFLFLKAVRALGMSAALAIACSYPLWSGLFGWFVRGEGLGPFRILGLCLVVLGITIVILAGKRDREGNSESANGYGVGIFLALGTSVLWAFNTVGVSAGGQGLHTQVGNSVRMLVALYLCPLVGLALVGPKEFQKFPLIIRSSELKKLFPVFIFESFLGSVGYMYAMTHSPLAVAAALSSLAPIFSFGIELIQGRSQVSIVKGLGVVGVTLGVCLLVGMMG